MAVLALCVPQAFQTSPGDVVTYSQGVEVHVAVAVASCTRSSHPGSPQGVTIVTVFTHLTAHPCTRGKVKEVGRNEMDDRAGAMMEVIPKSPQSLI